MLALMIDCFSVNAAKSKKKSVVNDSPKEKTDKRYDDLFKGKKLKRETGLISIILCEKEVYMEIPRSLLGEELIMGTSVVSSSAPREITEGIKPKPYKSVMFSKAGDMLNLGIVNKIYFNHSCIPTYIYLKESRSVMIASFNIHAWNS